jgi:hypothetical protein
MLGQPMRSFAVATPPSGGQFLSGTPYVIFQKIDYDEHN